MDKTRPLKIETPVEGGTQTDYLPTEVNPAEDYISAKGIAFEESDNYVMDLDENQNIQFKDATQTTPVTVTQLKTALDNTFDNRTNGFVSTNVQAAIEESKQGHFSYHKIKETRITIPLDQQMLSYQEVTINAGSELNIEGEVIIIR